ncbi:murein biosynthesis integral membrane protein MurJ [uncultured Psychroserpens sp.]|uniref:murein biosynthesis integral membrane protein MurJ n=1 Tax=uncultured Psychroserpens sp. TaxID=255436 RepID=UPI002603B0F7|nr:lipid II flippase MurJ [uncultured Psychroserpens sp.]
MIPKFNLSQFLTKGLKNTTVTNVITVGLMTLAVKGLGFAKEIVIADSFGLSELLDTFYIAILIPSLINGVFLGSFQSVFIPNYVSTLKSNKNIGAFQSTGFLLTIGISSLFFILAYLFTDVYLEVFFSGHTENYYELIKTQFYFVAPCILFWGFSSLLNALLTIDDEFAYSSLSAIFTPISIIIALLFFKEALGNLVLAIGTLVGSFLGFVFILSVALKRKIIQINRPDFRSSDMNVLFMQLPAKLSSSLLVGVNPLVDQYFSAQLIVGSIAALNYGIRIPAFAIGIVGIALGNVLLPYFSKQAVENQVETFKKLKVILKYLLIASSIGTVFIFILSSPIISLMFERNAFTSTDTEVVSRIQQMYVLQIPSYIIGLVMIKFLTSINKNNFMVLTSVISLVLNITLNFILIEHMGVYGLALATSIVSITNSVILYIYIKQLNKMHV